MIALAVAGGVVYYFLAMWLSFLAYRRWVRRPSPLLLTPMLKLYADWAAQGD